MSSLTTIPSRTVSTTKPETGLTPATDREIYAELEPLFLGFGTDAERVGVKRVALYVDACRGEPVWAVRQGIEAVRNGRDDGKTTDYLPSTQRVARAVRDASARARDIAEKRFRDFRDRAETMRLIAEEREASGGGIPPELQARIDALVVRSKAISADNSRGR